MCGHYIDRRPTGVVALPAHSTDMMIGPIEIRRRKFQFLLIAVIVTLISYLVLMINGLGVGLNALAGSALKNFDADAIAYADEAGLSVFRSELRKETIDRIATDPRVKAAAPLGYVAANYKTSDGKVKSAAFLGIDPGSVADVHPSLARGQGSTTSPPSTGNTCERPTRSNRLSPPCA